MSAEVIALGSRADVWTDPPRSTVGDAGPSALTNGIGGMMRTGAG